MSPFSIPRAPSLDMEGLTTVLSASYIITENIVGTAMIILPEIASGPGMLPTLGLYLGIYGINLVSGLLIDGVKPFEENEDCSEVAPSSFKDLADDLLHFEGHNGGWFVSALFIFINYCIQFFTFMPSREITKHVTSMFHLSGVSNLIYN